MNAQQMVEAAANWMDERKPGWERELDLGTFDIGDVQFCIIGQTFGPAMFSGITDQAPAAFRRAFCAASGVYPKWNPDDDHPWSTVERYWVDEIKARFNR